MGFFISKIISKKCANSKQHLICIAFWLLNPLTITVSSRGNAESVIAVLVLGSLYFLLQGSLMKGFIFHALAVHMKIYPILFIPAVYLYLGESLSKQGAQSNKDSPRSYYEQFFVYIYPNKNRLHYAITGIIINVALLGLFYYRYCL